MDESIRWHAVAGAYEHHRDRMLARFSRLYPRQAVEDALQEVFLRLVRSELCDPEVLTPAYIWTCVKRQVRRALAHEQKCRGRVRDSDRLRRRAEWVETPQACMGDELLAKAVKAMTEREADVLRMLVLQGMTYAEAARALGAHEYDVVNARVRGPRRARDRVDVGDAPAVPARTALRRVVARAR